MRRAGSKKGRAAAGKMGDARSLPAGRAVGPLWLASRRYGASASDPGAREALQGPPAGGRTPARAARNPCRQARSGSAGGAAQARRSLQRAAAPSSSTPHLPRQLHAPRWPRPSSARPARWAAGWRAYCRAAAGPVAAPAAREPRRQVRSVHCCCRPPQHRHRRRCRCQRWRRRRRQTWPARWRPHRLPAWQPPGQPRRQPRSSRGREGQEPPPGACTANRAGAG